MGDVNKGLACRNCNWWIACMGNVNKGLACRNCNWWIACMGCE